MCEDCQTSEEASHNSCFSVEFPAIDQCCHPNEPWRSFSGNIQWHVLLPTVFLRESSGKARQHHPVLTKRQFFSTIEPFGKQSSEVFKGHSSDGVRPSKKGKSGPGGRARADWASANQCETPTRPSKDVWTPFRTMTWDSIFSNSSQEYRDLVKQKQDETRTCYCYCTKKDKQKEPLEGAVFFSFVVSFLCMCLPYLPFSLYFSTPMGKWIVQKDHMSKGTFKNALVPLWRWKCPPYGFVEFNKLMLAVDPWVPCRSCRTFDRQYDVPNAFWIHRVKLCFKASEAPPSYSSSKSSHTFRFIHEVTLGPNSSPIGTAAQRQVVKSHR